MLGESGGILLRLNFWITSAIVLGIVIFVAAGWCVMPAHADQLGAIELLTERAIAHGASPDRVLGVVGCETGQTFRSDLIGALGERGYGQWLPGPAAWRETPAYQVEGIDIVAEYRRGGLTAEWHDADMLGWAFGPDAPPDFARHWKVCG